MRRRRLPKASRIQHSIGEQERAVLQGAQAAGYGQRDQQPVPRGGVLEVLLLQLQGREEEEVLSRPQGGRHGGRPQQALRGR